MTEGEAREWVIARFGAGCVAALDTLAAMVAEEATQQNLVSASTLDRMWSRHIVDSAQLIPLAERNPGRWIDIGTGAGFPGLLVAILTSRPVTLVEPRRRRVDFLRSVLGELAIEDRVTVEHCKIETVKRHAAVISARAVGATTTLLDTACHCATRDTLWLLPKGRSAREEVAQAQRSWHGTFHVEHSVTDPESLIVIATGVSRR